MKSRRRAGRSTLALLPSLMDGVPTAARRTVGDGPQAVMQHEWTDPDDTTPNAVRTPRTINAWRSYDPLRKCAGHPHSKITLAHIVAADLLRRLADAVAIGFSGGRDMLSARSWTYGPITGFGVPAVRSAKAWPAFRRAMALFDAGERELLTYVVLLNQSVRAWSFRQRELASRAIRTSRCGGWPPALIVLSSISKARSSRTSGGAGWLRPAASPRSLCYCPLAG
jgi:hypothetical protein